MRIEREALLREISDRLRAGTLPHAMILEGSGAEETAVRISGACVCTEQEGDKPCMRCSACKKALARIHPDIHIASGSGSARSFHVDEIRFIREDAYVRPNEAARKVYLFLRAEDMTESAQNALLKLLEEPPQEILFILVCENAKALLPTVLSRVQLYDLGRADAEEEDQSVLSDCAAITGALTGSNEMDFLALSAPMIADRERFSKTLSALSEVFFDASRASACGESGEGPAAGLCTALPLSRILKLFEISRDTREKLDANANLALLVTSYFSALYAARFGL
ncbi:MAG: ATP-binding protein [Clostridia bacterium]|nr:ATP-binding protein [Clostridia bacterium]